MFRSMARNILRAVEHVLFPPHCLLSGQPLGDEPTLLPGVHDDAWFDLPPAPSPDMVLAMLARHFGPDDLLISDAHALISIDDKGAVLPLVHAIKYGGRRTLAVACGRVLGELMNDRGITCDVIVPVPVHRARMRERGYNQAALIATGVSQALKRPSAEALQRHRYTGTQTALDAAQRHSNVIDAVTATTSLSGAHILLVDDVLTTGSTLQACAEPLINAGARRITIATIAVA